jgi:hypothetical protein
MCARNILEVLRFALGRSVPSGGEGLKGVESNVFANALRSVFCRELDVLMENET